MRTEALERLRCPQSGEVTLIAHGFDVVRGGASMADVAHDELRPDDDIIEGLIVSPAAGTAHLIHDGVAVLLADEDIDAGFHGPLLEAASERAPDPVDAAVASTLKRQARVTDTPTGDWNRDEMRYYDAAVDTPEGREAMARDYRRLPNWPVFLPRERHILDLIGESSTGRRVLEVGCGGARTVSYLLPPSQNSYDYTGIDISFDRLRVARELIPEGTFIQSSAMALPFADETFDVAMLFGVVHHLPDPARSLLESHRVLVERGRLGAHEPIAKPRLIPSSWKFVREPLSYYEHSEHDGELGAGETEAQLRESGFTVTGVYGFVSPVETLVSALLMKVMGRTVKSRRAMSALLWVDALFLRTLGRLSPRLGPHAAVWTARA